MSNIIIGSGLLLLILIIVAVIVYNIDTNNNNSLPNTDDQDTNNNSVPNIDDQDTNNNSAPTQSTNNNSVPSQLEKSNNYQKSQLEKSNNYQNNELTKSNNYQNSQLTRSNNYQNSQSTKSIDVGNSQLTKSINIGNSRETRSNNYQNSQSTKSIDVGNSQLTKSNNYQNSQLIKSTDGGNSRATKSNNYQKSQVRRSIDVGNSRETRSRNRENARPTRTSPSEIDKIINGLCIIPTMITETCTLKETTTKITQIGEEFVKCLKGEITENTCLYKPAATVINFAKEFGDCLVGEFTGNSCLEKKPFETVTNMAKEFGACLVGEFTGNSCLDSKPFQKVESTARAIADCTEGLVKKGNLCQELKALDVLINTAKNFGTCANGELSGNYCLSRIPLKEIINTASDAATCIGGFFTGTGCKYVKNYSVKQLRKDIIKYLDFTIPKYTCPNSEWDLVGLSCLKKPPDNYIRWDNDYTSYHRVQSQSESYDRGSKIPYLSKKDNDGSFICDGLSSTSYYDTFCNGWRGLTLVSRNYIARCDSGYDFVSSDPAHTRCYENCRSGYNKLPSELVQCWNELPGLITIPLKNTTSATQMCDSDRDLVGPKDLKVCYPKCPSGTKRSSANYVECIPDSCPQNYTSVGGNCVPNNNTGILPTSNCTKNSLNIGNNVCKMICIDATSTDCIDLNCPSNYKYDIDKNICVSLAESSPTCASNQVYINEKCFDPCPIDSTMNQLTGQCIKNTCDPDYTYNSNNARCEKILSTANKCKSGQTEIYGKCFDPCPSDSTMIQLTGQCIKTTCETGYTLKDNKCEKLSTPAICPSTQQNLNGFCYDKCPTNFDTQIEITNDNIKYECIQNTCDEGYINNSSTSKCEKISLPDTCKSGQIKINTKCFDLCSTDYNMDANGQCIKTTCETGYTLKDNKCEKYISEANKCKSGQTKIGLKCFDNCSTGENMDKDGQCIKTTCDSGFNYNSSAIRCEKSLDKCNDNQVDIGGKCYNNCDNNHFMDPNNGTCIENCKSGYTYNWNSGYCESNNEQPQQKCPDNTTLRNDKCYSNCIDGVMDKDGKCNICPENYSYNVAYDLCIINSSSSSSSSSSL